MLLLSIAGFVCRIGTQSSRTCSAGRSDRGRTSHFDEWERPAAIIEAYDLFATRGLVREQQASEPGAARIADQASRAAQRPMRPHKRECRAAFREQLLKTIRLSKLMSGRSRQTPTGLAREARPTRSTLRPGCAAVSVSVGAHRHIPRRLPRTARRPPFPSIPLEQFFVVTCARSFDSP